MKTAILSAFLGAALFLVTGNAIAASAVHDNPSLKTSSALQGKNGNIMRIAEEKKQAGTNKNKENRCKRLRAECQYLSDPARAEKVCTPQRVKWMNENCLGNDKN